jgi:hypothetical protein
VKRHRNFNSGRREGDGEDGNLMKNRPDPPDEKGE